MAANLVRRKTIEPTARKKIEMSSVFATTGPESRNRRGTRTSVSATSASVSMKTAETTRTAGRRRGRGRGLRGRRLRRVGGGRGRAGARGFEAHALIPVRACLRRCGRGQRPHVARGRCAVERPRGVVVGQRPAVVDDVLDDV